ncbi:hypothetical protein GXW83_24455 [Streptacidiphilus sp. PB12-B1b]|uniref:hypothetical protein n=1 Tax=Streptacidiphilus sp. PB12-B1b TaxID=2705012 RepID=UPI0015F7F030|nr:hypothetical protein [Streptacidiphilus sp. PB12-B1b]QMU78390.1 hypothetical protein GXW83_24455 [Streptacidiphilus sp. PB12-B1b]
MDVSSKYRPGSSANPFDPCWIAEQLAPMAARAAAGEPSSLLSDQLFESIWPWALRTAERWARLVPPGADRDAVKSDVLWEVFQATRRIEWPRYQVWPALLKARMRGGFTAAGRTDDPLTRGQRRARNQYLKCTETRTHLLGRQLTSSELLSLAEALGARESVIPVMTGRSIVTSLQGDAVLQASLADPSDTPETTAIRSVTCQGVRSWIEQDLPRPLAHQLTTMLHGPSEKIRLNARERGRLRAYLPALLKRVAA